MQAQPPADRGFEQLKALIARLTGLRLEAYKEPYLRRRIAVRMRRAGAGDYRAYGALLQRDAEERRLLVDTLGVNVTEFLRDPSVFRLLGELVIPHLVATKDPGATLRAWSAGCATGEEAYSLALVFLEALRAAGARRRFRIYATDVDAAALAAARAGRYGPEQLRNLPAGALAAYFRREGEAYVVGEALRQPVLFGRFDLTAPRYPRGFDLILCRNVIIYFDRGSHGEIFRRLYASLNPWGFLVLGRAESVWGACREMFLPLNPRERVYQRVEGWGPAGGPGGAAG